METCLGRPCPMSCLMTILPEGFPNTKVQSRNTNTYRMKKISKNQQSFLARKAMHIYKSTVLFLPILSYFCLFLPICESVANLHESTLLFALNIHTYFCLFFVI